MILKSSKRGSGLFTRFGSEPGNFLNFGTFVHKIEIELATGKYFGSLEIFK